MRLWNASSSAAPSSENCSLRLIFLAVSSVRFLKVGAEGAQASAADQMEAPEQQSHAAHEVEENDGAHCRPSERQAGGM